jgi:hypothetical protein
MSSSDREFEMWKLRDLFELDRKVHSDLVYENIEVANNGFPITFGGNRIELPLEEMRKR